MRTLSLLALASMLGVMVSAAGCVGDDPVTGGPGGTDPDAAVPCTGAQCADGSTGPGPGNDGGTGSDSAAPACSKIQVSTIAGSVAGGADGPGATATFTSPEGLAVDPATGTLYVADTGNHLVRRVLPDGTTSTYSSKAATEAWIAPRHASWPAGYNSLYVSDSGHDQVFSIATAGAAGASDFALGSLSAFAVQPVTFRKFVVGGTRVARWAPGTGKIEATVFSGDFAGGFVDGPAAGARYGKLLDLAFDGQDLLYVADQGNHRVRKVVVADGAQYGDVSTVAGSATGGHVDGTGAAAQFEGPNGFFLDPTTHLLYIADGATIRVMTAAGVVTTLAGSTSAFADGDGCSAKFINVKSIAKFANELYVLDVNRVRKIVLN